MCRRQRQPCQIRSCWPSDRMCSNILKDHSISQVKSYRLLSTVFGELAGAAQLSGRGREQHCLCLTSSSGP
jgi:hypothetical protein